MAISNPEKTIRMVKAAAREAWHQSYDKTTKQWSPDAPTYRNIISADWSYNPAGDHYRAYVAGEAWYIQPFNIEAGVYIVTSGRPFNDGGDQSVLNVIDINQGGAA